MHISSGMFAVFGNFQLYSHINRKMTQYKKHNQPLSSWIIGSIKLESATIFAAVSADAATVPSRMVISSMTSSSTDSTQNEQHKKKIWRQICQVSNAFFRFVHFVYSCWLLLIVHTLYDKSGIIVSWSPYQRLWKTRQLFYFKNNRIQVHSWTKENTP